MDINATVKVTVDELCVRIDAIVNPLVRQKVANIVYFDIVGTCPTTQYPKEFDKYKVKTIQTGPEPSPAAVEEALLWIGYPPRAASERSTPIRLTGCRAGSQSSCQSSQGQGPEALMYAIIQEAIENINSLTAAGVIVGGQVRAGWPVQGQSGTVGYSSRPEVERLIMWVTSGAMRQMLEDLGSKLDVDSVLDKIGFRDNRYRLRGCA